MEKETHMLDLSTLTLADLDAVVTAEKASRRADAVTELKRIAASHGFTLADFGRSAMRDAAPHYVRSPFLFGELKRRVGECVDAGKSVADIAIELGVSKQTVWDTRANIRAAARKAQQ